MSPKRIARPLDIYVRVSDTRGRAGESFISPEEQEDRCRAAIASRGLEAGEVFREMDVSGGHMERPELAKARKRVEAGVSGGIVVARIDRFGRTVARALDAIDEIDKAGGVVITAEGDFDTSTATGELVLNMMLTLAQFELRRIRENWGAAQRRAVERGVHISRHVPPGYQRTGSGQLEPHPRHGKTIARGFRMAAQGVAPAEVARYFTKRGLPSGGNEQAVWKSSRIKRLLANPVYLGEARYGDVRNPDAHEPLTDLETWHLAQRKSANAPAVKNDSEYLLSGLVRCASCRHAMRPQKARGQTIATYRCATETASGRCPRPTSISMVRLDDFVFETFAERFFATESEATRSPDDSEALATVENAKQALAEVEALKSELRPVAYARALDVALAEVEKAEDELRARQGLRSFSAEDALPLLDENIARIAAGGRPLEGMNEAGIALLRRSVADDIRAVFVRPAASRSKTLPIEDRVKIVWRGDEELLELPKRGERFEPRPYGW